MSEISANTETEVVVKKKRGRKPSKERKGYFYEREEEAVVNYLSTDDDYEKNKIYDEILKPAFTKMIESIIRRYNLYPPDEEFQQTFEGVRIALRAMRGMPSSRMPCKKAFSWVFRKPHINSMGS